MKKITVEESLERERKDREKEFRSLEDFSKALKEFGEASLKAAQELRRIWFEPS